MLNKIFILALATLLGGCAFFHEEKEELLVEKIKKEENITKKTKSKIKVNVIKTHEGVMLSREYNRKTRLWDYKILLKDKSKFYVFSADRKILYKNDLIQFQTINNKVKQESIKLIEEMYFQKYWKEKLKN